MNNFKKIGLTALAASLVSVSANAGEISVAGGASMNAGGYSGEGQDRGTTFTMGNQLTFSGSGELDNGLNVSVSFVIDQGDDTSDATGAAPFDSHSVTVTSESLGTLVLRGEGGSSASAAISTTAAGNLWDNFDETTSSTGVVIGDLLNTAGDGDDSFMYTSPELMDGLTAVASYQPQNTGFDSGTGFGVNYTGVEGLTLNYADTDTVGTTALTGGDNKIMKASYAYGSVTVAYSNSDHDVGTTDGSGDTEMTSYALTYTVTDELSVTVATEESSNGAAGTTDAEIEAIKFAYTAGGMTLSGSMVDGENLAYSTATGEDMEYWTLGASFAF
jgi:outer membrane protein OmpU